MFILHLYKSIKTNTFHWFHTRGQETVVVRLTSPQNKILKANTKHKTYKYKQNKRK